MGVGSKNDPLNPKNEQNIFIFVVKKKQHQYGFREPCSSGLSGKPYFYGIKTEKL
jgi:hypothetical protein